MHRDKSEAGFSLLEMLVVLGILLVVLGSAFALMKNSLAISNTTFELTEAQQNLRVSHEYMNRDLIMAGDGLNGINNVKVAQGFVTNYLAQNVVSDPLNPGYVNLPVISSDGNVPANIPVLGTNPAINVLTGSDRITILALDSNFAPISIASGNIDTYGSRVQVTTSDAATVNIGEIYCFTSQSGAAFGAITGTSAGGSSGTARLFFQSANSYGLNQPVAAGPINQVGAGNGSGTSTQSVSMTRVKMIHYYINAQNLLMKRVFGVPGAGFTDNLVAEHVTNLKFRYFLNLFNSDGSVQQPVNQLTTAQQQVAVRQIELSLWTQTTHATTFVRNSNGSVTGTPQQSGMTTSVSIRNMQFRQAQQPS